MQWLCPHTCTAAYSLARAELVVHPPRSYNRQDACQDRLQCYSLQLISELGDVLDTRPFNGPNASMYGGCQQGLQGLELRREAAQEQAPKPPSATVTGQLALPGACQAGSGCSASSMRWACQPSLCCTPLACSVFLLSAAPAPAAPSEVRCQRHRRSNAAAWLGCHATALSSVQGGCWLPQPAFAPQAAHTC